MTNPHPTGSDASVTDEMVERDRALTAVVRSSVLKVAIDICRTYGADVPASVLETMRSLASPPPEAYAALPTPTGKHIEDVYPDEAVAWRAWSEMAKGWVVVPERPIDDANGVYQPLYANVLKSGALVLAEIERLDRLRALTGGAP